MSFENEYDPLAYDTSERKEILDKCKDTDEMLRLVYKWIHQNKITMIQYLNLLNYVMDQEEKA
ncbi:MAG: hypothetical protein PHP92_03720 [Candidatus Nanoarchaeia archaeon]|nr:hypothetical protein [Candidatus Nanoarchaeia archaeon]